MGGHTDSRAEAPGKPAPFSMSPCAPVVEQRGEAVGQPRPVSHGGPPRGPRRGVDVAAPQTAQATAVG